MKYKDESGQWKDLVLPATGDTLPVGTVVEFEGDTVPSNWTQVEEIKPNDYTTEEQVIGTWMGKPLYRRILNYTTPDSAVFVGVIELEAFLDVKKIYGTFYYKGTTYHVYPLPYGEGEYFNNVTIQNNYVLAAQNGFPNSPCTLVIEYTKATD